tara:strand:+ start:7921 stop:8862 length:942 start_codon:yes stop_codon:yes gene_type:complete
MNKKKLKIDISIIIPIFKPNNSIKFLISTLLNNTVIPNEIILINSGSNFQLNSYYKNLSLLNKSVIYKKVNKLHPGTARNLGIKLSKSKYITFFDVNTFPSFDWLEKSYNYLKKNNLKILLGRRLTLANNYVKNIIKFSTYGENSYISATGTIILRSLINENNLYFLNTRAGEDIDWLSRLEIYKPIANKEIIYYHGLSDKFLFNINKWFTYSLAYSDIHKDLNHQKKIYFFLIIYSLIPLFIFEKNTIYIFFTINMIIYLFYFSILRPIRNSVLISNLFPLNWILISFWRIIFDISKLPGLLLGFLKLSIKK